MLHLAVIGIVCAVSAPSEGTASIGQKNNESNIFCNFEEGQQNVAKVPLPSVYNVDVYNSSNCVKQKITNRSSSFFYDYIIKQYQNGKYSSCSIMENVSMEKEKKLYSNVDFGYKKRNLLWSTGNSRFPSSTRHAVDVNCLAVRPQSRKRKRKKSKVKNLKRNTWKIKPIKLGDKRNLNFKQKIFSPFMTHKIAEPVFNQRHLDTVEVNDELDINKRIDKIVKEVALENQRKEECSKNIPTPCVIKSDEKSSMSSSPEKQKVEDSFSFGGLIKKLFTLSKDYFNSKKCDIDNTINSNIVNNAPGQDSIVKKTASISSFNDFKKVRKTRFKRNSYNSLSHFDNQIPKYRNNFIELPYSTKDDYIARRRFLYPLIGRSALPRKGRRRRFYRMRSRFRRPHKKWKRGPYFRKFNLERQNIYDPRLKRYDSATEEKLNENSTAQKEESVSESVSADTEVNENTEKTHDIVTKTTEQITEGTTKNISVKEEDYKTTEKAITVTHTSSEEVKETLTESVIKSTSTQKIEEDALHDHTLEKPFLQRDFSRERFENYRPNSDFDNYDVNYNFITDSPLSNRNRFQKNRKHFNYDDDQYDDEYLDPFRLLKIRHALRNYLIHNNIWNHSKRNPSFERRKRCGAKTCSLPRKCWRSAPLLCVPYIKKGQEDILKYLIRVMQQMMGKPFPPKVEIFEKTKFKPCQRGENHPPCDQEMFQYECLGPPPGPPPCLPPAPPCAPAVVPCSMPPCAPPMVPCSMPPCPPAVAPCPVPPCAPPMAPCPPMTPCPSPMAPCPSMPPCPALSSPCRYANSPIVSRTCPVPPFPYSAKLSPGIMKPSAYAKENVPREFPCPGPGAWPSDVPFYIPHAEQMIEQNPAPYIYDRKPPAVTTPFLLATPFPPTLVSYSPTTTAYGNIPVANSSPAALVSASDTEYDISTEMDAVHVSDSNPFVFNANGLPSQNAPNTVTAKEVGEPTAEGNAGGSSSPSTKSACALYVSNSPVGQEEYFSYTAVPYNKAPRCSTEASQYVERASPIPLHPELSNPSPNYNQLNPQKLHIHSPDIQRGMQWSTTSSAPALETTLYQSKMKEMPKNYKTQLPSPVNPSEFNQIRKEDKHRKFEWNKNLKKNLGKSLQYEDYPVNDHQMQASEVNYGGPQKRFFRMKHYRRVQKPNSKNSEFFSPYDYYVYEKYPEKPNDMTAMKYGRYPMPQIFWKDYGRKMKSLNDRDTLIRRKRGDDYYFGADNFDNYNDYLDDSNYDDDNLNKFSERKPKIQNNEFYNAAWTPPSFVMFSELAKAVSKFNTTTSSFEATTSSLDQSQTFSLLEVSQYTDTVDKNTSGNFNDEENLDIPVPSSTQATSTTEPSETEEYFTQSIVTSTTLAKSNEQVRAFDSKKSGKSFFQINTKTMQNYKNYKKETGKDEKESDDDQDLESLDESPIPTTLKTATIVKGQKKSMTKPSPKGYSKVFPDSFEADSDETLVYTNAGTTVKDYTENRTALLSSTTKPDIRLQLLAVCEGYLEVAKLIKSQNQTIGEDLDADLARYCENIISQSFNSQSEKPKKFEINESLQTGTKEADMIEDDLTNARKLKPGLKSHNDYDSAKEFSDVQFRDKIVADILKNPPYEKEKGEDKNETSEANSTNIINATLKEDSQTTTKTSETVSAKSTEATKLSAKMKRKKKRKSKRLLSNFRIKKQKRRKKEETKEDSSKKGMSKEEAELIHILRKRKKALLSWLFNTKNQGNLDESQETEYFDDEDLIVPETDPSLDSGTISPKRDEKRSGTTQKYLTFVNASIFPVYAKQYGYDKGGELREVEVLWRKINEKTHEERILKNLSVLALLMPSTNSPSLNREVINIVDNNGYENIREDPPETEMKRNKKLGLDDSGSVAIQEKIFTIPETNEGTHDDINTTPKAQMSVKLIRRNATHTFISKPDPSSIVGVAPNVTTARPNTTRKTSHKMEVAKDIFQEYTIEFLNYAVYILPIMLTILFLFCCLCCGLHILKTQQSLRKYRKNKKAFSTDDTSDTTEESGRHSKKRKREARCKRKTSETITNQKGHRKFWNVLKLPSKASKYFDEENRQASRKKTILRFLTDSGEAKGHESNEHSHDVRRKKQDGDCRKSDDQSEAAERKELIALLEELKKIETEHTDEKKEVKSVQVQYMTQEDDDFPRAEVFNPHQKNVFGMPKGYSFYSKPFLCHPRNPAAIKDYELYEEVNELTELLPCECNYFSKKNEYLRHCDFSINPTARCERLFKIVRDSGMSRNGPFKEKDFMKNESENRSFIFNKYRSISTDTSEELMGVAQKNAGTEVKLTDNASPLMLPPQKNAALVEEVDDLKRQLNNNKKYIRLKDDGVLCRL